MTKQLLVTSFLTFLTFNLFAEPIVSVGKATLEKHRGVNIIHLYGTRAEMAYQHGMFARQSVKNNTNSFNFYSTAVSEGIKESKTAGFFKKAFQKLMISGIVSNKLKLDMPADDRAEYKAYAAGLGVDFNTVMDAMIFPDVGGFVMSKGMGKTHPAVAWLFDGLPKFSSFGCTSFMVDESRAKEGLLHARILDFYSVVDWENNATVLYFHPSEAGAQDYAAVTTLGVHAAPTGFNESGLVVELHELTLNAFSFPFHKGEPVLPVVSRILRQAKTVEQAVAILQNTKLFTGWRFNISSAKENMAVFLDVVPGHVPVVHNIKDGLIVTSNHVYEKDLQAKEFFPNFLWNDSSHRRDKYPALKLKSDYNVDIQKAIDVISSSESVDENQNLVRDRVHGSVTLLNNVYTVVFDGKKELIYLSVPNREGEIGSQGQFVALPWVSKQAVDIRNFKYRNLVLRSNLLPEQKLVDAIALYRKAMQADERDEGQLAIEGWLEKAALRNPEESLYQMVLGLSYFKRLEDGLDNDLLNRVFEKMELVQQTTVYPYYKALASLIKARVHTLRGDAAKAKAEYSKVDFKAWPYLMNTVVNDLNKGYSVEKIKEMSIHYAHGDLYTY